jgi:hypothetical protein
MRTNHDITWRECMAPIRIDDTIVSNVPTPIKWEIPDSLKTEHATHLVVQQRGSEFTLLFFEQETLLFSGTPEEQIEAYKALEFTKAKCLAKIVMSVEDITLGINNLITSLNRYHSEQQAAKGQADAETKPEYTDH